MSKKLLSDYTFIVWPGASSSCWWSSHCLSAAVSHCQPLSATVSHSGRLTSSVLIVCVW